MAEVDTRLRVDNTDAARGIGAFKRDLATIPRAASQAAGRASRTLTNSVNRQFDGLRRNARDLRTVITEFAIGFGLGAVVGDVFRLNNQLVSARNALGAFTDSAARTEGELKAVSSVSQQLGSDMLILTDQWTKLRAATASSTLPSREIFEIFRGLAESARVLNLDAKRTEGVFRAIIQMFSKGKVQAEELRGQMGEHIPGAFEMAAQAMGVTTKELDKMIADGKVFADDLVPKLAQGMRDTFGKALPDAMKTSQAAFERLKNELKIFVQSNNSEIESSFKFLIGIPTWIIQNWGPAIDQMAIKFATLIPAIKTVVDVIREAFFGLTSIMLKAFTPLRAIIEWVSTTNLAPDGIKEFAKEFTTIVDNIEKTVNKRPEGGLQGIIDRNFADYDRIVRDLEQKAKEREAAREKARQFGGADLDAFLDDLFGERGALQVPSTLSEEQLKAVGEVRKALGGLIEATEEYDRIYKKVIANTIAADGTISPLRKQLLEKAKEVYALDVLNFQQAQLEKEAEFARSIGDMAKALEFDFNASVIELQKALIQGLISGPEFDSAFDRFQEIFKIDKSLIGSELRSTFDELGSITDEYNRRRRQILIEADEQYRDQFIERNKQMYQEDLANYMKSRLSMRDQFLRIMGDTNAQLKNQLEQDFQELTILRANNIISDEELAEARQRLETLFAIDSNSFLRGMRNELELMGESISNVNAMMLETFGQLTGDSINRIADAIGSAVAHGENLSQTLNNIGRSIVASIISSLVKMGAQMLVNFLLGKTLAKAALATTAAEAAAATALWTTPAYLASVATLGGAAGIGSAALAAGMATSLGATAAIQSSLGSVFGGGLATGGTAERGRLYRVGEGEGGTVPEVFRSGGQQFLIPPERGRVTPLRSTEPVANSAPTVQSNVTVNVHNAPSGTTVEQTRGNDGLEIDVILAAVDKKFSEGIITGESKTATSLERVYGVQRNRGRL